MKISFQFLLKLLNFFDYHHFLIPMPEIVHPIDSFHLPIVDVIHAHTIK